MATNARVLKHRILVVDDEPSILETSALVLRSEGYEVQTAENGFAALNELRRSPPALLISDLAMPRLNGFELLSIVREQFPLLPVVVISGHYSASAANGSVADAFFTKGSYRHEELFTKIRELLERNPAAPSASATE
jgi:two-component system sensor histidine kinase/response regulator